MRISDWSSDVCSSDLKSHPLAEPGDWLTMPEETFLVRLDPTTKLSDEAAEDKESRLRTLAGADGQVYGRASIWPDRYSSFFDPRSEEHTSELQSLMRNSYAVFCLKKKKKQHKITQN